MKEHLDSDRVNFLVWRYLLEGNYRETAAKFQKEWHVREPHRQFDFAPHVKHHALVSTLNRGLLYHALEREYIQSHPQAHGDASPATEVTQLGVFGPLVAQHAPPMPEQPEEEKAAAATTSLEEQENPRKRQGEKPHSELPNGSPAKKPRFSNGCENGADAATTPMELVQQQPPPSQGPIQDPHQPEPESNHAYPSPLEGEPAPTPVAHTDGPEQSTQVDRVKLLGPGTVFLEMKADDGDANAGTGNSVGAGTGTGGPGSSSSEASPIILHCEWNPTDPSTLAAAGTDALVRLWDLPPSILPTSDGDHVDKLPPHPYTSLRDPSVPPNSTVTALSWSGDGAGLAVAYDCGSKSRVTVFSATDGAVLFSFYTGEPPIIKLRWSPTHHELLGIGPDGRGTALTVYSDHSTNPISYSLGEHNLLVEPLDAAWTGDTTFIVCGGETMTSFRVFEDRISVTREISARPDDSFQHVVFDQRSSLLATAGDRGSVSLWDESGQRRSISAHIGTITALKWQPLQSDPPTSGEEAEERLLATGGEDGAICIWNARQPDNKAKCFMTMDNPVLALAFTPDGAFIAGATADRILIWKVDDHTIPRASWARTPHPGWLSPGENGESEETEHCLVWDATGHRLAYGVNSRLAVINVQP